MGLIGIVQNDIKRVVAYSTLSQLGYMTVALGASAYSAAIFHLMTHAFFKALLFLAAGSVIIAMHHEQDIRKMGGLKKYMPITYWVSLVGSLALIGFPGFAGYFSKDAILIATHNAEVWGSGYAYLAVLLGVFVTAFYSFRMFFLVFHGEERMDEHTRSHLHETPAGGHGAFDSAGDSVGHHRLADDRCPCCSATSFDQAIHGLKNTARWPRSPKAFPWPGQFCDAWFCGSAGLPGRRRGALSAPGTSISRNRRSRPRSSNRIHLDLPTCSTTSITSIASMKSFLPTGRGV